MADKPVDTVRWSVDGTGKDALNVTVPTSDQQNTGWTLGQKPSSGLFNWLANRSYRWFKWLSDGDCQFHDLSATGTLDVTGSAALSGPLDVAGNTTLGGTLGVAGDTTMTGALAVTRNTTLGGALVVAGDTTLTGALTVGGAVRVDDAEVSRNLKVGGGASVAGSVSAASYRHGPMTVRYSAQLGGPRDNTVAWSTNVDGFGIQGPAPLFWRIPVLLPDKKRILNVRARVKCDSGTVTAIARRVSGNNGGTTLGFGGTTTVTGSFQTIDVATGLTEQVGAIPDTSYQVNIGGDAGVTEYVWIEVVYDQIVE
jgi:cytoskeletal protein CcmA (bactofilin family)